jgi:outer membrane protein
MIRFATFGLATVLVIFLAGVSHAADEPRMFVNIGAAYFNPSESAGVILAGAPVPGANISLAASRTLGFELGAFLVGNLALSVAAGAPPTVMVMAAGSISQFGKLGQMKYGPAAITLHYHFNRGGTVSPYIGGGVAHLFVLETKDGFVRNFEVEPNNGAVLQAGVNVNFNKHVGAVADFRKARLRTTAKGLVGPSSMKSDVTLDPFVALLGLKFAF